MRFHSGVEAAGPSEEDPFGHQHRAARARRHVESVGNLEGTLTRLERSIEVTDVAQELAQHDRSFDAQVGVASQCGNVFGPLSEGQTARHGAFVELKLRAPHEQHRNPAGRA